MGSPATRRNDDARKAHALQGSRDALRAETGEEKLPAMKLPDGTVLTHSKAILSWVSEQRAA